MPADRGEVTAQTLWLTAPRKLEFRRETVPPPGPGEVRVRAIASAISHGTEMLVYRGQIPPDLPLDLPTLAGGFGFPIKYGYAAVGRVMDVGTAVENCLPGDTVFVHHPHQDIFLVPASMAVRLPAGLDPHLGLFTANLETAVNVLLDTPLHIGETAVVFGQGTVGLLITQLLRHAGAGRVVAVDPLERRRDLALALGAHESMAPDEDLPAIVRALTGGRGADVAMEASGSAPALQHAIECVAVEGTIVVVSWYGTKPATLTLGGHFHRGRVRLRSSQVGRLNPELSPRWDNTRRLAVVTDLLPRLHLEGLISHRFPFGEASSAYHLIDEHPDECVQVVLTHGE
ncbi:MAG: zinc-binding dehydrogenase [Chloroflexota bacterium]|nr:zinc-binding dehydrogenase [Chloroflexota bacterium]